MSPPENMVPDCPNDEFAGSVRCVADGLVSTIEEGDRMYRGVREQQAGFRWLGATQ